jgi:hypothetical protein
MNTGDWTALAALATGVMAIATFILALKTWSMASATQGMAAETKGVAEATLKEAEAVESQAVLIERQLKISTSSLRASVQPWLTWVPSFEVVGEDGSPFMFRAGLFLAPGWHSGVMIHEDSGDVVGALLLRNVGTGLALIDPSSSLIFGRDSRNPFEDLHPTVLSPVVPPNEQVELNFRIKGERAADETAMTIEELTGRGVQAMAIEVAYSDVLGDAQAVARFEISRQVPLGESVTKSTRPWKVVEIKYSQSEREPIIVRSF